MNVPGFTVTGKLAHNVHDNIFIRNYHSVFFEG